MARNLRPGPDWIPAVVTEILGPVTYLVRVGDHTWKRHADQLKSLGKSTTSISEDDVQDTENTLEDVLPVDQASHNREVSPSPEPEEIVVPASTDQTVE